MSEREIRTPEDVHRFLAELDATQPVGSWREVEERAIAQRKEREQRERTRQEREARAAEEKQQRAVVEKQQAASTDWYAAVDTRIRTHFKDWAWAAIDERIEQWWKLHSEPLKDGIGGALGATRERVRKEFKGAIEEQQRSFETKLAEQKERHDDRIEASLARERAAAGEAQTQLREEVKRAIEQLCDVFGAQLAEQKEHFLSVPGKLPVAKFWQPESVTYEAQVVCYDGSLWQACKDTAQAPRRFGLALCRARRS
jgi:hypothetical protein